MDYARSSLRGAIALAVAFVLAPTAGAAATEAQPNAPSATLFGFNGTAAQAADSAQSNLNAPLRRVIVNWASVQPQPDSWSWRKYDNQYQGILAAGLRPLIVVVGSPCWAQPATCSAGWAPPDPDYDPVWGEFAGRVATRYPESVAIEVWNEQNLNSTFAGSADPARYAELLVESYEAVKAVSPSTPVISGGLVAGTKNGRYGISDANFLAGVYAAGAGDHMDGIGIHPYPKVFTDDWTWRWDVSATMATLDRVRDARDAAEYNQTPLWITEIGEATATQDGYPPPATEKQQANDLIGLVRAIRAMPDVSTMIIHKLIDTDPSMNYVYAGIESGFGVYRLDGSPKPAACALSGELGGSLPCSTVLRDLPPSAAADSPTLTEDDSATMIDVLANDMDLDGGSMTIEAADIPSHGTIQIAADRASLTYRPEPDYCNSATSGPGSGPKDTFTYTLNGGSSATVSVEVTCVDDPPTARDDSFTLDQDAFNTPIPVLPNDANDDGGPLKVQSTTNALHGRVTLTAGGSVTYKPDKGYCNTDGSGPKDTFTYTLNGGSTGTVSVAAACAGGDPPDQPPPDDPPVDDPPADRIAAAITGHPRRSTRSRRARFEFVAGDGDRFECSLDGSRFRDCAAPRLIKVGRGRHRFRVRVADTAGMTDSPPAVFRWKVARKRHRR